MMLTKKQKILVKELRALASKFSLDYNNIEKYEKSSRTTHLELAKDQIIRSQVIIWYTLVDEFLNAELCNYFFGKKTSFIKLWKTKKFQNFNYFVLEELSLLQKLRYVNAIRKIPKKIKGNIEILNMLRNGLAHSFFPENLRKSRPFYKGKNIFTMDGISTLHDDMGHVFEFFHNRVFMR